MFQASLVPAAVQCRQAAATFEQQDPCGWLFDLLSPRAGTPCAAAAQHVGLDPGVTAQTFSSHSLGEQHCASTSMHLCLRQQWQPLPSSPQPLLQPPGQGQDAGVAANLGVGASGRALPAAVQSVPVIAVSPTAAAKAAAEVMAVAARNSPAREVQAMSGEPAVHESFMDCYLAQLCGINPSLEDGELDLCQLLQLMD